MRHLAINTTLLHDKFIHFLTTATAATTLPLSEDEVEVLFDFYLDVEDYQLATKLLSSARSFHVEEEDIIDGMQVELLLATDQANRAYEFIQLHYHSTPYFIVQKIKVYLALGKKEDAIAIASLDLPFDRQSPDAFDIAENLGHVFLENGCIEEGLKYFNRCQKLQPDNIELAIRRIDMLTTYGYYDQAIDLAEKLIDRDAYYLPAWEMKIQALKACHRLEEALEALEYALAIAPKNWGYCIDAAQITDELHYDDQFLGYIEQIKQLCPNNFFIPELLGNFYYARENNTLALKYYKRLIKAVPKVKDLSHQIKLALADIYHQRHKWADAREWVLLACKDEESDAFTEEVAISIAMDTQAYKEAILHAKKAIKYEPNNGRLHGLLGCILLDCGETKKALLPLRKACQLQPENVNNFVMLAIGYFHNQSHKQAARYLQQAYDQDKNTIQLFTRLVFQRDDSEIIKQVKNKYQLQEN